jgi:hypothetical protein
LIDEVNYMLTMLHFELEIKHAIFDLNKESALGPDGFGAFFQTYWDILKHDAS